MWDDLFLYAVGLLVMAAQQLRAWCGWECPVLVAK